MNIQDRIYIPEWSDTYKWQIPVSLFLNFEIPLGWESVPLRELVSQITIKEKVNPDKQYKLAGVRWYGEGVFHRETKKGKDSSANWLYPLEPNAIIYNRLFAWKESFAVVTQEFEDVYVSNEFPQFRVDRTKVLPEYLYLYFIQKQLIKAVNKASAGSAAISRNRFKEEEFMQFPVLLPPMKIQLKIIDSWKKSKIRIAQLIERNKILNNNVEEILFSNLSLEIKDLKKSKTFIVDFKDINRWSFQSILLKKSMKSQKYELVSLSNKPKYYHLLSRGRSPKYDENSKLIVLNQKCNRWNKIDLNHAKTVSPEFLDSIPNERLTKVGDIIINSTGEGTIGRASYVSEKFTNLYYDSHILMLRLNSEHMMPYFFTELFNSRFVQLQIEVNKSAQSTKQTELGIDNTLNIEFPAPSLKDQEVIINQIKKSKSEISNNKILIENEQIKQKKMMSNLMGLI